MLVAGADGDVAPAEVVVFEEVAEAFGEEALAGGGLGAWVGKEGGHSLIIAWKSLALERPISQALDSIGNPLISMRESQETFKRLRLQIYCMVERVELLPAAGVGCSRRVRIGRSRSKHSILTEEAVFGGRSLHRLQ